MQDKGRPTGLRRVPTMQALRRHRGWLSGWLVALLLYAQLATAAYACPRLETAMAGAAGTVGTASAAMAGMPGCDGDMPALDPDQPQLCKAHCEAGQQTLNSQGADGLDLVPTLASGAALIAVLDPADAAALAAALPITLGAGPPAGTPPLYLSLHVLRN